MTLKTLAASPRSKKFRVLPKEKLKAGNPKGDLSLSPHQMFRKRPSSILALRALSKVSSSPLLFYSSTPTRVYDRWQNPNEDFYKRNDFDHVNQLNASGVYGGNVDGYQRNNLGDFSQLNSRVLQSEDLGEDRGSNLNVHQRSNFGGVNQLNSNGFPAENPRGPRRNSFGENRQSNSSGFSGENLGEVRPLNSNGFSAENTNGNQRNNLGEIQRSNSNGYQTSNFGGAQQLHSHGYLRDYTNQSRGVGFQKESSRIGGVEASRHYQDPNEVYKENHRNSAEFNHNPSVHYERFGTGEASQNAPGIYWGSPNAAYQKSPGEVHRRNYDGLCMQNPRNPGEFPQNPSGQVFVQNPNTLDGYNKVEKIELREFQPNLNGHISNNQQRADQNFYGLNREIPLAAGQQSLGQFPLSDGSKVNYELNGNESTETGESITYNGTLIELDECCEKGNVKEAVTVLDLLRKNCVSVDLPRYLKLLQACGEAKSLEETRVVHNHIYQAMGEVGVVVNNKILDLYSKSGWMDDAYQLFERMPQRNITSWDTMISGLVNNNLGEEAIDLFTQFKQLGMWPDGGLFIAVFNACGSLGAVDEGMLHFESMKVDFNIAPTMEHYVSIVDMLGGSGYLDEALEFIEKMPVEPSVHVWETLMNLCFVNGYKELGNRCAEIVEQLDSSRLNELTKMGILPVQASDKTKKKKDNSNPSDFTRRNIELKAGDRSHPEHHRIYEQLRTLVPNMKEAGYIPNTNPVLHDVDIEARAEAVLAHSEKLAAAYILMTSPARSDMRILKNLRFCPDCHEAMKIISKITGRKIISRDAKRFHHFENGICSCKDYY